MIQINPVILCGGMGTRLWPLSSSTCPKQFLALNSRHAMLKETILRLDDNCRNIKICSLKRYKQIIQAQIPEFTTPKNVSMIFESKPVGTLVIAIMASLLNKPDSIIAIIPADHYFENITELQKSLQKAAKIALNKDNIVLLGTEATFYNGNYGYIKGLLTLDGSYDVIQFLEKPQSFQLLQNARYFWNLGIFIFKANSLLQKTRLFYPELLKICAKESLKKQSNNHFEINQANFSSFHPISLDKGIAENAKDLSMISINSSWYDLGSWNSLILLLKKHKSLNHLKSILLNIAHNLQQNNCLSENYGCPKYENFSTNQMTDYYEKIVKPWGFYQVLSFGKNFLIKYLQIAIAAGTSLQVHQYRDEYSIILSGTANVAIEDKLFALNIKDTFVVKRNCAHKIKNNSSNSTLKILEIQVGYPISEYDIIRIYDQYGRL